MTDQQIERIAELIRAARYESPTSIDDINWRSAVTWDESYSARQIKRAVEMLRERGELIGSRRGKPGGYYLATTPEELERGARSMLRQAFSELRTARKLVSDRVMREWLGQEVFQECRDLSGNGPRIHLSGSAVAEGVHECGCGCGQILRGRSNRRYVNRDHRNRANNRPAAQMARALRRAG